MANLDPTDKPDNPIIALGTHGHATPMHSITARRHLTSGYIAHKIITSATELTVYVNATGEVTVTVPVGADITLRYASNSVVKFGSGGTQ